MAYFLPSSLIFSTGTGFGEDTETLQAGDLPSTDFSFSHAGTNTDGSAA